MTQANEDDNSAIKAEAESFCYTLAKIFAQRGEAKNVAILADSTPSIKQTDYDSWDGGTYYFTLFLRVPVTLFAQIEKERETIEKTLQEVANPIFRLDTREDRLIAVQILPSESDIDSQWREKAKQWANGKGLTNQGRVRSDNIATKAKDGLLFRSGVEILLYEALKESGVSFAPLPVFVRGGRRRQRMEPDFIIIKKGITLQVEVDGDTVHTESPAEAQTRVAMLEDEGVHVHRILASDCDSPSKAAECAKIILEKIETRRQL